MRINSFLHLRRLFVGVVLALGAARSMTANAATINVPAQYSNIQDAINNASVGDTIVLADGTYSGTKNHDIDFSGKAVIVKSANGPTNCIIDCKQLGRAFIADSQETSFTHVEGITIKNGLAQGGGGIYTNASLMVINCVFTNNTSPSGNEGGGMYGGTAQNCTFTTNTAGGGGGMSGGTATNCTFTNNTVTYNGGGTDNTNATNCTFTGNSASYGGGMETGTATTCTFTGNTAGNNGGGIDSGYATNCKFINNSTTNTGYSGGGMSGYRATGCLFYGNTSKGSGGGVYQTDVINCTIVNNTALGNYGGGIYNGNYAITDLAISI